MKQRPDADKLANELLGASAFFRGTPQPAKADAEPATEPTPEASATPDHTETNDVVTSPAAPISSEKASFDINLPTASRDSLRLSMDETKAIDQLHQALKWDHDLSVSKNDIYRAALHHLLEDWTAKGSKSAALARLKRKHANR